MQIQIMAYQKQEIEQAIEIWNQIVEEGVAFPQKEPLTAQSGDEFFLSQSYTGIGKDAATGEVLGLYILHPNNIGRCGHICNASYAVNKRARRQGVGEALVKDCMQQAKTIGFRILQFNAVVKTNASALHLYKKLGFTQLGVIPGGFRLNNGTYEDIIPHYIVL
ncbi:MAG: GNAT family N-acetyltransferase [Eubacteriales bacterium]|nr:GNAT family N-acetyltransferase [Eubacteriales bacterium]